MNSDAFFVNYLKTLFHNKAFLTYQNILTNCIKPRGIAYGFCNN